MPVKDIIKYASWGVSIIALAVIIKTNPVAAIVLAVCGVANVTYLNK